MWRHQVRTISVPSMDTDQQAVSYSTVSYRDNLSSQSEETFELEMRKEVEPVKNTTPAGGYEHEFIDKIPDKFKCMICHKIQKEATIVSCCCKHYCKSCIEEWFRQQGKRKRCPHCRSISFNHFVNKERVQDINELKLYCSNRDAGCRWGGKLEELESHVNSKCDFTSIDCTNNCHETMLRKKLGVHKQKHCLLRSYTCQYCHLKDTYHAITGECGKYGHCDVHKGHYKTCQDFPLECPNECGKKTIKRKNMSSHLKECLLQPVDCPFEEVGCTARVVRRDLQEHVDSSDHHHLMLMMTAFKELKEENRDLKYRVLVIESNNTSPGYENKPCNIPCDMSVWSKEQLLYASCCFD